ncbi:hypothetical protein Trydic_g9671 [Trypoxylus dichotomus]
MYCRSNCNEDARLSGKIKYFQRPYVNAYGTANRLSIVWGLKLHSGNLLHVTYNVPTSNIHSRYLYTGKMVTSSVLLPSALPKMTAHGYTRKLLKHTSYSKYFTDLIHFVHLETENDAEKNKYLLKFITC